MIRTARVVAAWTALSLLSPSWVSAQEAQEPPGKHAPPHSFAIPQTDTTVKFNGFAETALFYELVGGYGTTLATACDYYLCAPTIALGGQNALAPQTAMTSAYSRFGIQTDTPSPLGVVVTRFEVDGAAAYQVEGNSYDHADSIRIRHAYGAVGDFLLVGQTWTTFADLGTWPDQFDENPVANLAPLRGPMVRARVARGPVAMALAIEDPYLSSAYGPTTYWNVPDLVGRVLITLGSLGTLSVRGVVKQYKNATASGYGGGAAVGAKLKLGRDTLAIDVEGGPGIGSYMYGATLAAIPEDVVQSGTTFRDWMLVGGSVGYTRVWSRELVSNVMVSGLLTEDSSAIRTALDAAGPLRGTKTLPYDAANKAVYTSGVNTRWFVTKSFWWGPELYVSRRQVFNSGGTVVGYSGATSATGTELRGELVAHFSFF